MAIVEAYSTLDNIPLSNRERTTLVSMSWMAMTRSLKLAQINSESDYFYRNKLGISFWLDVENNHIDLYYEGILIRSWSVGNSYISCYMEEYEILESADYTRWLTDFYTFVSSY